MRHFNFILMVMLIVIGSTAKAEDWKTFENKHYGFQFRYPQSYHIWHPKVYQLAPGAQNFQISFSLKNAGRTTAVEVHPGPLSAEGLCAVDGDHCSRVCEVKSSSDVVGGDFKGTRYILNSIETCYKTDPSSRKEVKKSVQQEVPPVYIFDIGNKNSLVFKPLFGLNPPLLEKELIAIFKTMKSLVRSENKTK